MTYTITHTITHTIPKCMCPATKPIGTSIDEFPTTCYRCGTKYTLYYKNRREDGVEIGSQYCVECYRWKPFTIKDQLWYEGTLPLNTLLERRTIQMKNKKKSGKGKNLRRAKNKLEVMKNRVGGARQRTLKRQEKRITRLQIDLDKRNK